MFRPLLSTVSFCALVALPLTAESPLEIGTLEDVAIWSEQLAAHGAFATRDGWELEIHHPGATYIALHFAEFELPDGEWLRISDPTGAQSSTLSGRGKMNAGRFWSRHIKGDRVLLEFSTRRSVANGFEIDRYAAGHVDLDTSYGFAGPGPQAICGADDKKNAVCYQSSHPTTYDRARAVARLLIQGTKLCTGWLASAANHLITNEHCITDASDALNTDYEFMAEADKCPHSSCVLCDDGTVFEGAAFIQDDANLDYALVQIDSGNPAATYGFLEIDDRDAVTGESIYIPQHPGGFAKEIAVESSETGSGSCEVEGFTAACAGTGYLDVGYMCDTKGGSSGSPVIATNSHKVIALHHCADCLNRAVPINLIYDEIGPIVDPPPCTLPDDDLHLHDDTVLGNETHEACETITAGSNYVISTGGDLTVRARDRIVIRSGTSIAPGAELRVDIDPMTGAP